MEYVHVRNLETYHPGYRDRALLWAKIHIRMIQGDPDCERITDEIDWARLIKFILLELNAQKPIPIDDVYLIKKGFNLKRRPIALTLKALEPFVDVVSEMDTSCTQKRGLDIDIDKDKDKDKDKDIRVAARVPLLSDHDFVQKLKQMPAYKHIDIDFELSKMDGWLLTHPHRKKTRRFVINWLNKIDRPMGTASQHKGPVAPVISRPPDPAERKKVSDLIHKTKDKIGGGR